MKFIICFCTYLLTAQMLFSQTFTLRSKDLGGQFTNQFTANTFGCNGANKSPALSWVNPPAGTKSFAVTMYDPDAPTGSGFWHWIVTNIPISETELKQGVGDIKAHIAPNGSMQGRNDAGFQGYLGPCPPEHEQAYHYISPFMR